jgi:hypothetical protein
MRYRELARVALTVAVIGSGASAGCSSTPGGRTAGRLSEKGAGPEQRVAEHRPVLPPGQPDSGQETFSTPDDAVKALLIACRARDHAAMGRIFGPASKDFVTGDKVEDENDFNAFADSTAERAVLEQASPAKMILHIGRDDWAFPIPIQKTNSGDKWYFDTGAGEDEIMARRIGSNELEAIALCRAYVDAQREYASLDRDGSGVLAYAQRLVSSPGRHDGLYWPATSGLPQSPFGPLIAAASAEGYAPISGSRKNPTPYHGYYFHILKAQGPHAPGGAYDYVVNGNMIAGFALVASPAEYRKSGVMTFIVSHNGKVYEKDLGSNTSDVAASMNHYDPDGSWKLVKE